jgi:hypothetical protein
MWLTGACCAPAVVVSILYLQNWLLVFYGHAYCICQIKLLIYHAKYDAITFYYSKSNFKSFCKTRL